MIKIPERFKKILNTEDNNLHAETAIIINNFNQIYSQNETYFFNEYTDHGIRHINSVLEAIDKLITEDSWDLLSANDLFILVFSIFLHDLGMHIQPLTFVSLITGEYDKVPSYGFIEPKWSVIWEEYLDEAKKWNEETVYGIFGERDYEIELPNLEKFTNLNENQRKLIGEFIRRNHPRIAYEVAFKGLKTHDGDFIDLCPNLNADYRFLAGIVARSHGINIRDTFSIIKSRFSDAWKFPRSIHVIYLMVLLRLADYFQIDESRILKIPYKTKQFKSPISIIEHQKHLSTIAFQSLIDDPETIFFTANPSTSILFISLRNLFLAIQFEFDTSWAILGEIYGILTPGNKPKIKYKRVKSNLEDNGYIQTLDFVPDLISFSADKELLKLLIAPLYGYDPIFGIRELLQNSVDACWERKILEVNSNTKYSGEIQMTFDMDSENRTIFAIQDNGKGMTLNEIKNYFLRAGSSLKKNMDWKKKFVSSNNKPSIHRIGKFGIGVLAAYLLGDEIKVETRSSSSEIGYKFKTKIDDSNIEISKSHDLKIGTLITIYIADSIRNRLLKLINDRLNGKDIERSSGFCRWDKWFAFSDPSIKIKVYNFPEFSPYSYPAPSFAEDLPPEWHEFKTVEFEKILWTFSPNFTQGRLICNGIVIPNGYEFTNAVGTGLSSLKQPFLSIFDFNGNLQLDLNRNSVLSKKLQFNEELFYQIYADIFREILYLEIPVKNGYLFFENGIPQFKYNGFVDIFDIFFTEEGFIINLPHFNRSALNRTIICLELEKFSSSQPPLKNHTVKIKLISGIISPQLKSLIDPEKPTSRPWRDNMQYKKTDRFSQPILDVEIINNNPGDYLVKTTRELEIIEKIQGTNDKRFSEFYEKVFSQKSMIIPYNLNDRRLKFEKELHELDIKI